MHLSPAHLGLHRAVRERVNADSLLPGLIHSIPTRCTSVSHLSVTDFRRGPLSSVFYIRYMLASIGAQTKV